MSPRHLLALVLLTLIGPAGALACGAGSRGASGSGNAAAGDDQAAEGSPAVREELAKAKVYDAKGQAYPCPPARQDCPAVPPDTAFLDRCRLTGYQVRQCGCDTRCAGNVARQGQAYDAGGKMKECAPATEGCEPPPAGAAFQDACTERGHRLSVCGCEWLCSGDPTRAR